MPSTQFFSAMASIMNEVITWQKPQLVFWIFQDTFSRAKTWVKELQRQASPNIVIALAGNKADLANKRVVEYEVMNLNLEQNLGNIVA